MKEYYEQIDEYLKTYSGCGDVYFKDFEIKTFRVGFVGYMVILLKALAIQAVNLGILYCARCYSDGINIRYLGLFTGFVANLVCAYVTYGSLSRTLYRAKFFSFSAMIGSVPLSAIVSVVTCQATEIIVQKNLLWTIHCVLSTGAILIVALTEVSLAKSVEAYEQYKDMCVVINSRKYLHNTGTVEQILKGRIETNDPYP